MTAETPFSFHGRNRNIQRFGDLWHRQADKIPEVDNLRFSRTKFFQLNQCLVHRKEILSGRFNRQLIVTGVYTFTLDTSQTPQNHIVPDQVMGMDVFNKNGSRIGCDALDSGVNTDFIPSLNKARITIGGLVGTVDWSAGGTNDFRVIFDIDDETFEVIGVFEKLQWNSTVDPFYLSQYTTVRLLSVPEPSSFGLGVVSLVLAMSRRPRRLRSAADYWWKCRPSGLNNNS